MPTMVGDTVEAGCSNSYYKKKLIYTFLYNSFCCRNNGLALPLIALQYHDVRVNFEFAKAS